MAVDEPKDKNGEKKVNFFNCVAFKSGAVFVSKYFKKGDGIIVIGRMDSYKGNDEKTYWNIIAESHDFPLGRSSGSAQATAPVVDAASGMEVVVNTDEVPF